MTNRIVEMSPRQAALTAGVSLFVMVAAVILAVPNTINLIVPEDATKTVKAIQHAGVWYRVGILGWFIVLICDVIVSLALYVYFKPVNQSISLLTAWIRLFYTAIFGVMLVNLLVVMLLLSGSSYLNVFSTTQLNALVMLFLTIFQYGWMFALGFFGIHLFGLGYLSLKSSDISRLFGILLVLASVGYLFDTLAFVTWPSYNEYKSTIKAIVSGPNAVGELAFALWLLFKGGKAEQATLQ